MARVHDFHILLTIATPTWCFNLLMRKQFIVSHV